MKCARLAAVFLFVVYIWKALQAIGAVPDWPGAFRAWISWVNPDLLILYLGISEQVTDRHLAAKMHRYGVAELCNGALFREIRTPKGVPFG